MGGAASLASAPEKERILVPRRPRAEAPPSADREGRRRSAARSRASRLGAAASPLPSFRWSRGTVSPSAATLTLRVGDLTCRGRANLFVYFLDREDDLAVLGPLRVAAWPAPGEGEARIAYDPALTDAEAIRVALTSPVHDPKAGVFRMSPFRIAGYDPLAPPAPRR